MNHAHRHILSAGLALAVLLLPRPLQAEEGTRIHIAGRSIMVNGAPYSIRGICYHPVPKGSTKRSFDRLNDDLVLMADADINTIRVYAPIDDPTVLDRMHQAGIKVIVGFGYNQDGHFDILSGSFINYINTYKHHPAILMWEFGNEYNYHPEWFGGDINNWYNELNRAAEQIHEADPAHPVSTAHGELPTKKILAACPAVDVWGMNVYRWDKPGSLFPDWRKRSEKPMYLSEAGADSFMTASAHGYKKGPNQKAQADATRNILAAVFEHPEICAGVTLFSFTDGWWKAGNPDEQDAGGAAPNSSGVPYDGTANEEYWGIVDLDRTPKEACAVVKLFYADKEPSE
ncbi:MAG: hypothetical protein JXR25_10090 [Pontiellaceae bacterium]|nr:hypothetical protein [Pontiellaceae bacterium]MBN2785168.1 hypothetical protein [Pontiellaceae bacterium]